MRVMTLNTAHGRGNSLSQFFLNEGEIRRNLDRIATLIRRHAPDVVALQEADGPCAWSGSFDHVAYLAERSGFAHHWRGEHGTYTLGNFTLTYGTALMSRGELHNRHSRHFGLSWRDSKGFVSAQLVGKSEKQPHQREEEFPVGPAPLPGITQIKEGWDTITFVSLHLDFLLRLNRKDQLQMLSSAFENVASGKLVIMGDFNCTWESDRGLLREFCRAHRLHAFRPRVHMPTFPTRAPRRRLDWILCSEAIQFKSHAVVNEPISDHCVVVAELEI